jgi:uncharacterized phage-associated protein
VSVLRFDETKTTQAASEFLKLSGGKINYMVLIKFLYLLDRQMLLRRGQTVTGDEFYTMKLGPVLSVVHDLITEQRKIPGYWNAHISSPADFEVALVADPGSDRLSITEQKTIRSIWEGFNHFGPFELCEFLHKILPEVKTIQEGRIPLTLEEVLTIAGKRTAEETEETLDDLESVADIHALLAPQRNR